jgi:hypothetical protein
MYPFELKLQNLNAMFELELIDSSGLFVVEPTSGVGSTNVGIRLAKGPLDYENPNQHKFILLVIGTLLLS